MPSWAARANIEQGATLDFDTSVATTLPALDLTPTPDELALAPTAAFSPEVIATLRPGDIIDQPLGEIAYPPKEDLDNRDSEATDGLTVSVKDYHIKINKCGGR